MNQNSKATEQLFEQLWQQYVSVTPSADLIHKLLSQGEPLINDHIALRTFNLPQVNLSQLARHFIALGYEPRDTYVFEEKQLDAQYLQHPDSRLPKVFISELRVESLSEANQKLVMSLVKQVEPARVSSPDFLTAGRPWSLTRAEYQQLQEESEYAAWLAAFGYRANHFTVSVNQLSGLHLADVNSQLKKSGFSLNDVGGEIKGSADVGLAQSATLADTCEVMFQDGPLTLPSCFYEFAERFELPEQGLYHGFVPASADKIFHSTDRR